MATIDRRGLLGGAGLAAALPRSAGAQPRRAVRLVVPAAPGGAIDVIGRLYAQRLGPALNQVWVVENRSGANNTLGAAEVARSAPDGQTLLVNADIQLMAKHVMRSVPYDPVADFTPIGRLAASPLVLVGNPQAAPQPDLDSLVAALRAAPDRFTFANSALGSMGHLATESLKRRVGADTTTVVSYRGTAPALTDVLSGLATLMVAPLGSALPHIAAGKLRGYAVFGARRSPRLPDIPATDEAGLPGLDFTLWYALWGPKNLPGEIVQATNEAVQAAGKEPALAARLAEQGAEPVGEDPMAFARFIAAEALRNGKIAEDAGIRPE